MKSLVEHINESFFDNVGADPKTLIEDWMTRAGRYKEGRDYIINDDLSIHFFPTKVVPCIYGNNKPDLFPNGMWPDYIRFDGKLNYIECNKCNIVSLKGFPKCIQSLTAAYNKISSLKDCTIEECDTIDLACNELTSYEGGPIKGLPSYKNIIGEMDLTGNKINTLKGLPAKVSNVRLSENCITTFRDSTLEDVNMLDISSNSLESLAGMPNMGTVHRSNTRGRNIAQLYLSRNRLQYIDDPKYNEGAYSVVELDYNNLKSVVGVIPKDVLNNVSVCHCNFKAEEFEERYRFDYGNYPRFKIISK